MGFIFGIFFSLKKRDLCVFFYHPVVIFLWLAGSVMAFFHGALQLFCMGVERFRIESASSYMIMNRRLHRTDYAL
jgi:hypothetical protein